MPGLVQFDRPQRCWFWLLYSCVHRCAAAAALSRAEGMRVGCAASAQSGLLVCYMTLASNEAAAPRRALEAATGGTKLTHRRTDSSPIPQIRSPPTRKELVLLINFGLAGARGAYQLRR